VSYDRKTQMKGQIFSYRLVFKFCAGITSVKQSEHQKKGTLFSVRVFSTAVLIVDTVNKKTNIKKGTEIC